MGNLCSVTLVGWQHCYEARPSTCTRALERFYSVRQYSSNNNSRYGQEEADDQWTVGAAVIVLFLHSSSSLFINMADGKGSLSPFSTVGFICSVFLVSASLFFERWKQFVTVSLLWFLLSGRRYRFLYMVVKTLPRDARLVTLDLQVMFVYGRFKF